MKKNSPVAERPVLVAGAFKPRFVARKTRSSRSDVCKIAAFMRRSATHHLCPPTVG